MGGSFESVREIMYILLVFVVILMAGFFVKSALVISFGILSVSLTWPILTYFRHKKALLPENSLSKSACFFFYRLSKIGKHDSQTVLVLYAVFLLLTSLIFILHGFFVGNLWIVLLGAFSINVFMMVLLRIIFRRMGMNANLGAIDFS